jgi:hypothetical protein
VELAFLLRSEGRSGPGSTGSVDVSVAKIKLLAEEKVHDITFVFSDDD